CIPPERRQQLELCRTVQRRSGGEGMHPVDGRVVSKERANSRRRKSIPRLGGNRMANFTGWSNSVAAWWPRHGQGRGTGQLRREHGRTEGIGRQLPPLETLAVQSGAFVHRLRRPRNPQPVE